MRTEPVSAIAASSFESAGSALKMAGDAFYFRYVSIPGTVVSIGEGAFRGSTLEVLRLSDGTTTIGAGAFDGCSALSYVVFNETLEEVGDGAFEGCVFLGEDGQAMDFGIEAMSGHKFTGENASSLAMYVPSAGGTITSDGLAYKITGDGEAKTVYVCRLADPSMKDLDIPASVRYLGFDWTVTSVGSKAFMGNRTVASVASAVDVGFKAFANCSGLTRVTLDGADSLGSYAFANCGSLAEAELGTVSDVGASAFSGCRSLSKADLSGVRTIGKHAFYGCALTAADLSSATSIGYGAFTGTDLREATFCDGLEVVDSKAFFRYAFKDQDGARIAVDADCLAGKTFEGSDKVLLQTA